MDPIIGEIRAFAFNWAPYGWVRCDGSTYNIQQFQALYAVIGGTYGGNLQQGNFNVPNLQGRVLNGSGTLTYPNNGGTGASYAVAGKGGTETVALTENMAPPHTHDFNAAVPTDATLIATSIVNKPVVNSYLSSANEVIPSVPNPDAVLAYSNAAPDIELASGVLTPLTGGSAHDNRQPYLVINYCICYDGVFLPKP